MCIETHEIRRQKMPIVCAHSLRTKSMAIAASSPNLSITTAAGCVLLLMEQAVSIHQFDAYVRY